MITPISTTTRQTYNETYDGTLLNYVWEFDADKQLISLSCFGSHNKTTGNGAVQESVSFNFNYLQFPKDSELDCTGSFLSAALIEHIKNTFDDIVDWISEY